MQKIIGTTILAVRRGDHVALGGDGQVSLGHTVMKANARKIRRIKQNIKNPENDILAGFAGGTADAFTLFERFEAKLLKHQWHMMRSAYELAKDWRTDKMLRQLEAMLCIADKKNSLIISGNGDVIEPGHDIMAIGSGGDYARAAAYALLEHTQMQANEIVETALHIASEICIYTNNNIVIEELSGNTKAKNEVE